MTVRRVGECGGRSVSYDHLAFVDLCQEDPAEVDRPDPVVCLVEADVVLFQRVGNEEQLVLEAEGAGVRDALHEEVPRVLEGR